jgi:hypothetical protein
VECGTQQHSVKLVINLQQHHLEIWLSLEVDKQMEINHPMLLISSTQQHKYGATTLSQARYQLAASSIGEIVAFGGGTTDGSTSLSVVDMLNVTSNT